MFDIFKVNRFLDGSSDDSVENFDGPIDEFVEAVRTNFRLNFRHIFWRGVEK